ncbi:hypothetical protein ACHAXT_005581 [Thalassiosira profunda]
MLSTPVLSLPVTGFLDVFWNSRRASTRDDPSRSELARSTIWEGFSGCPASCAHVTYSSRTGSSAATGETGPRFP